MTTTHGHTQAVRAKVMGTDVKNLSGQKIGEIEDVIFDRTSNNIMFAVVGFGGFLGITEKYHPIPLSALSYSELEESYVVNYTRSQLQAAPAASIDDLTKERWPAVPRTQLRLLQGATLLGMNARLACVAADLPAQTIPPPRTVATAEYGTDRRPTPSETCFAACNSHWSYCPRSWGTAASVTAAPSPRATYPFAAWTNSSENWTTCSKARCSKNSTRAARVARRAWSEPARQPTEAWRYQSALRF